MTEITSAMDIDVDENHPRKPSNKGKDVASLGGPPQSKATPWVEKYRPESLDDVAAHRDIIDTSNCTFTNSLPLFPPTRVSSPILGI